MFLLRVLFAWLLMAALPMQGFAAASMLFCGMGVKHQHTIQASEPHDHVAMQGYARGVEHGHAQASDPTPPVTSTDTGHKCSICAACCNVAALVGLDYVVAMALAPQVELTEPFVLIHALATPVPDKPPRA